MGRPAHHELPDYYGRRSPSLEKSLLYGYQAVSSVAGLNHPPKGEATSILSLEFDPTESNGPEDPSQRVPRQTRADTGLKRRTLP